MRNRVPSFFMLVPGPWRDAHELARSLSDRGIATTSVDDTPLQPGAIRVDVVEDDQLAKGFSWGREGRLADDLVQRVAACSHAALLECGMLLHESAANVAQLGRALRDAGGVAVRMEASGNASAWEPWLERLESGVPAEIYKSAVILVGDDDGGLFTCGMHHFDLPDAEITMIDTREAIAWLDAFCIYQLAEAPVLMSGHTFRPDASATRRTLERWPDHRHHPNDGRYNPFGLWRFKAPGTSKVEPRKLVSTIIPPLVAALLATERKQGRPLTQHEVEELVASSPAIAMEPADAQTLERSRGYADIEPELAWQQWQLVRAKRDRELIDAKQRTHSCAVRSGFRRASQVASTRGLGDTGREAHGGQRGSLPLRRRIRMDANPNPYSPPSANIVAGVDTAMAGDGHMVSTTVVELLRRTKTWVRVVGVFMWLAVGFMGLAAIGMGVVSLTMGAAGGAGAAAPFGSSGMMLGMTLMYLVLAGVYVMPATKLWSYGSRIDDLLYSRSNADLEAALDAQRGFWTFVGVAFLAMIALYVLVFVGAVAFGALSAASSP